MPKVGEVVWLHAKVVRLRKARLHDELVLNLVGFYCEANQLVPTSARGGPPPAAPPPAFHSQVRVSPQLVEPPADELAPGKTARVQGVLLSLDGSVVSVEINVLPASTGGVQSESRVVTGALADLAPAPY
jgi:hypothetical protein